MLRVPLKTCIVLVGPVTFIIQSQNLALALQLHGTYTFSIEISTGSEINEDLHDGIGVLLGTLVGGLKTSPTVQANIFVHEKAFR